MHNTNENGQQNSYHRHLKPRNYIYPHRTAGKVECNLVSRFLAHASTFQRYSKRNEMESTLDARMAENCVSAILVPDC